MIYLSFECIKSQREQLLASVRGRETISWMTGTGTPIAQSDVTGGE